MAIGWLIFIAIIMIIVVLFQVTKTLDLVSQLKGSDHTPHQVTKFHAILSVIFMVLGIYGFFWCFGAYNDRLIDHHSSEHGIIIHRMFQITLWVTGIVFVICNILLFWFAYAYRNRPGNVAVHFAHSNKLEFIWTIVPTIVMTGLVVFGLQAWNNIMGAPSESATTFEVTAQQFFWLCRYPGADGQLGPRDYDLICSENPVGIVTREWIEHRIVTLKGSEKLKYNGEIDKLKYREWEINKMLDSMNLIIDKSPNKFKVADVKDEEKKLKAELKKIPGKITIREKCLIRITTKYTEDYINAHSDELTWGYDDFMPSEIHAAVNQEMFAKIVALDVLHDFYVPYMDVKMDAVPGMPTSFKFTPKITTDDKRIEMSKNPDWQVTEEGDSSPRWEKFNYEVACAELCGVGHSSMKYTLVVETQDKFNKWQADQQSKWSQVAADLKLENGISQYAPKTQVEIPSSPIDSLNTKKADSTMITLK